MSYVQSIETDPDEELAQLHYFSIKKGEVEFVIAVKEYAQRNRQHMRFFAQSDKPVNQKTAAFIPFGWGETITAAISECLKIIRKYPYEPV